MFGGVGGEIMYRPFDKNYAIGADTFLLDKETLNRILDFRTMKQLQGI